MWRCVAKLLAPNVSKECSTFIYTSQGVQEDSLTIEYEVTQSFEMSKNH